VSFDQRVIDIPPRKPRVLNRGSWKFQAATKTVNIIGPPKNRTRPVTDSSEVDQMIEDCEKRSHKMNDWELKFIDDISTRVGRGESLHPNTILKLEEVWERIT
jgi:hypothetical protein